MNSSATAPPLMQALAGKVCNFGDDALTPATLVTAKLGIIDTVATTLAGIGEPCAQIPLRTAGIAQAPGRCLIFGTGVRTSALDATFVNGVASHALDYDDFSGIFGGHQSVPVLPALFALAEERRLSGQALLTSYLLGIEVEIRLARSVNYHHYDKGWHPTATLGTIGAAAAAAHLMGLDENQTTMALAIAPSLSSGLKANFGTMTKPLHVGQCGRNGLLAALLAEGGFDANPEVMEHHQGFFNVFNGPGKFDPAPLLEDWGPPFEIEDPSIALKQFPCCGSTHPAITLALELARDEDVAVPDIAAIEILPHSRRLPHTDKPFPTTTLEAKFSVQYVVARALLDGAVRLNDFEPERVDDPEVRNLLALTQARPHPEMADDGPEQWGAEVKVTLKDGRVAARRVDNLVGRGGDNQMNDSEMWEKFQDCGSRVFAGDRLKAQFEALSAIENVEDVNEITGLLVK